MAAHGRPGSDGMSMVVKPDGRIGLVFCVCPECKAWRECGHALGSPAARVCGACTEIPVPVPAYSSKEHAAP